jgi:hypothetical protein
MRVTKVFAISILAVVLAMASARAGSEDPGDRSLYETLDDALQGLMERMSPAFEELLETFKVLEEIDSIEHYERPEILPNGDIIMRRREDAPPLLREDDDDADTSPEVHPGVKI